MSVQYSSLPTSSTPPVDAVDPEVGKRGPSLYATKRPHQDRWFTVAYCVMSAITFVGAVVAFFARDPRFGDYTADFYAKSLSCDIDAFKPTVAVKTEDEWDPASDKVKSAVHHFTNVVAFGIPVTVIAAVCMSVGYIRLLRSSASHAVWVTIYVSIGLSVATGFVGLLNGNMIVFWIFLVMSVLSAIFYYMERDQMELCAKLLSVAGQCLQENSHLVTASIFVSLVGTVVMCGMLFATGIAFTVGQVGPNSDAVTRRGGDSTGECFSMADEVGNSSPVDCCMFTPAGWAVPLVLLSLITLLWTTKLVMELRLYIVADVTAAWYFSTAGTHPDSLEAPSIMRASEHALTTSFGSIALASLIITLIGMLRAAMRRQGRRNIFCLIVGCVVQPLLKICEQFTQFSTIACAITGLPFIGAAKEIFGVLTRNLLNTYTVWWVPGMVLRMAGFVISLIWATLIFTFMTTGNDVVDAVINIWIAVIVFFFMLFVLMFMADLLLDIVNSVYICYAMDRDACTVTKPEFHDIFKEVSSAQGAVIQNPDGGIAYGATELTQQAPQQTLQRYAPQQGQAPLMPSEQLTRAEKNEKPLSKSLMD